MPLFAHGIFVAEVHIIWFRQPFRAMNAGLVLGALDAFARDDGESARGTAFHQIATAYRNEHRQGNTTEIQTAMENARILHQAGDWQAYHNSFFKINQVTTPDVVVVEQIVQGAEHGREISLQPEPSFPASDNNATARDADGTPGGEVTSGTTMHTGTHSVGHANVATGNSSRRTRMAPTFDSLDCSAVTGTAVIGFASSDASASRSSDSASIARDSGRGPSNANAVDILDCSGGTEDAVIGPSTSDASASRSSDSASIARDSSRGPSDANVVDTLNCSGGMEGAVIGPSPSDASAIDANGSIGSILIDQAIDILDDSADTEAAATGGAHGRRHVIVEEVTVNTDLNIAIDDDNHDSDVVEIVGGAAGGEHVPGDDSGWAEMNNEANSASEKSRCCVIS